MTAPRILAFSGSSRRESYNQRLVGYAAERLEERGGAVTVVNLGDFPMPLMNQDLERQSGLPEHARRLKALLVDHDGLLISAPEYNSSITPLLKNALDWASRREEGEAPMAAYRGKTAALLSASPGRLGGMRGLVHLRGILNNLGVLVLPGQVSVASAADALDANGRPTGDFYRDSIDKLLSEFLRILTCLKT